ncbi:hypothetical protein RUM44_001913 [Polyplax serrata]|uniref:Uncharacterized protein n=1 Tax=Polyplax serrata TaxID=468196 RepID=A0ABR1ALD8_POLSC
MAGDTPAALRWGLPQGKLTPPGRVVSFGKPTILRAGPGNFCHRGKSPTPDLTITRLGFGKKPVFTFDFDFRVSDVNRFAITHEICEAFKGRGPARELRGSLPHLTFLVMFNRKARGHRRRT